jgi:HamA
MCPLPQPEEFWEIQVHGVGSDNGLSGLCVGYENGDWRYKAFADYIMEWLPEFCLNSKERTALSHQSAVKSLRKAAKLVYQTDKYSKRGEFGEIFLHAAIRCVFNSLPAISKIYYKSSANNTVKGFDCVHIVGDIDELELWLGEVKFYTDGYRGIREVVTEIQDHLDPEFLRNEFILIGNKLNDKDSYTANVQKLISERTSLDKIFKRVCIPVLVTYQSDAVEQNSEVCESYLNDFHQEIFKLFQKFSEKISGFPPVRFHLFLMPIEDKAQLIAGLNEKLKVWQQI